MFTERGGVERKRTFVDGIQVSQNDPRGIQWLSELSISNDDVRIRQSVRVLRGEIFGVMDRDEEHARSERICGPKKLGYSKITQKSEDRERGGGLSDGKEKTRTHQPQPQAH